MTLLLEKCPLCSSGNFRQIYDVRDRHYGIQGTYRIVRCSGCSLVFLNPMLSDPELSALYPADYYAYQDNFHEDHWKKILHKLCLYQIGTRDPAFPMPGRMLDLGCGSGWFLSGMRNKGWETFGVEINAAAAEIGRNHAGLNIFSGTVEQAGFPSEYFDYVRSNHSFEHISRPNETLKELYRILRRTGKILIGVPNIDSLNARLFGQFWWYLGAPVHPFNYSVTTLTKLLNAHGFNVESVTYNSDSSGILGSLQIFLNRSNGRTSTEGRLFNNRPIRVPVYWLAKLLDFLRWGDAIEVVAVKA